MSDILSKNCEYCGKEYLPTGGQYKTQKYCCRNCKEKALWHRNRAPGKIRIRKGGYNRNIYIKSWLKAQDLDKDTAPCYICGKRLKVDGDWVLDHKQPLSSLKSREESSDLENLAVCCRQCNSKKGNIPYEEFIKTHGGSKVE